MDAARSAIDRIATRPGHFVDGAWMAPATGETLTVEDPSTAQTIGCIAQGDARDIDAAVAAASAAMARRAWSATQRQDALLALAAAIETEAETFAGLECLDGGKPISAARAVDVPAAAAILRYYAGWAVRLAGETAELAQPGAIGLTLREPVGVVGQIIPWNYPLMGAVFKIGPAIAAGCACVLKPAEQTSLSALHLAGLTRACGIPAGFVNVVTGSGQQTGAALVAHPGVAKVSFTGSTATGIGIAAAATGAMKRVTVELGGKSPVIVMPDADVEAAAQGIARNIFSHAGQTCSAGSRLLVHASLADRLTARIVEIGQSLRMGPTIAPETTMGPVISQRQRDRIKAYLAGAVAAGARAMGQRAVPAHGYYVAPTVLTDVHPGMAAVDEEIFGPVLCVMPFETLDLDAIAALANASHYGLAAYVWTASLASAQGLALRLKAGTVRINGAGGGDLSLPSGGVKMSGFGREGGRAGVEAYTEIKSVAMVS